MAEVNAGMADEGPCTAQPVLDFRKILAKQMLANKLNDCGMVPNSPIFLQMASEVVHILKKRKRFQGKWDFEVRRLRALLNM
jgi:hypothetical protein